MSDEAGALFVGAILGIMFMVVLAFIWNVRIIGDQDTQCAKENNVYKCEMVFVPVEVVE